MIKRISEKIGFTETEIKVIFFLFAVFIIGFSADKFLSRSVDTEFTEFDYSTEDSLFALAGESGDESLNNDKITNSSVDYKQEVLDFNKQSFDKKKPKEIPAEKSIDINNAGVNKLTALPGIGEVTAEKIIDYRLKNGKFEKLEDLMNVKGIGKAKFNKIKKYLYIEL